MKLIFGLLFLVSAIRSDGQKTDILCLNLRDSTGNLFYIGLDNRIKVVGNKLEGNYAIEIANASGSLSKTGKNEYIVRVNSVMNTFSIRITQNGKEILRKQFKTRTMPEPFATWNGVKNTTASRSNILNNPFLVVLIPHYYFRGELNIVSFRATFVRSADSISTYSGGNQFTNEQTGIIKLLKSGEKIYFDNIMANNSKNHGEIMWDAKLSPFWIKIE